MRGGIHPCALWALPLGTHLAKISDTSEEIVPYINRLCRTLGQNNLLTRRARNWGWGGLGDWRLLGLIGLTFGETSDDATSRLGEGRSNVGANALGALAACRVRIKLRVLLKGKKSNERRSSRTSSSARNLNSSAAFFFNSSMLEKVNEAEYDKERTCEVPR